MIRTSCISIAFASVALVTNVLAAAPEIDTATIESVTGLKGTYNETENVFKVSKPRDDVKLIVDRWTLPPFMGITSWAAFTPTGKTMMVMGDTVLLEDEVNPAMSAALDAGLEVTALHNHFFFDQPRVFFMHIGGMGETRKLASAVKAVYDRVGQVRAAHSTPASSFPSDVSTPSSITAGPIEEVMGTKAESKDGMVKFAVGRTARMHGTTVGNAMGVHTSVAFAGSDEQAVVDGDFVMRENELQTVLKTMRAEGINIMAIHQHMTHEVPRLLFLHYWGKGKAVDLARAVKKTLVAQQGVR